MEHPAEGIPPPDNRPVSHLPLGDVPLEQWAAVFALLDGPSLGRAAGVCREWRGVADDSGRWLELFAEREQWVRLSCGLGEEAVEEPQACKAALREAYERKKEAEQAAARAAAEAEANRPRPKDFSVRQTHLHYAPKKCVFCVSETGVVLRKPAGFSRRAGDELEKFAIQKLKTWAHQDNVLYFRVAPDTGHTLTQQAVEFESKHAAEICRLLTDFALWLASKRKRETTLNEARGEQTPCDTLRDAAKGNNVAAAKAFLADGETDVNAVNRSGVTVLFVCAQFLAPDVAKLLVADDRVDVNLPQETGSTPLHMCAQINNIEVAQVLLGHEQVDINHRRQNDGCTALSLCAWQNSADVARLLVQDERTDVNLARANGETPLVTAAAEGHLETAKIILESGRVDPASYKVALQAAKGSGERETVAWLKAVCRQ